MLAGGTARRLRSAIGSLFLISAASGTRAFDARLYPEPPTPGTGTAATLRLENLTFAAEDSQSSAAGIASYVDVIYSPDTRELTIDDWSLTASDVAFFPFLDIDVTEISVTLNGALPRPSAFVDAATGAVTLEIPFVFEAMVESTPFRETSSVVLQGHVDSADGFVRSLDLVELVGPIGPFSFQLHDVDFRLTGSLRLNLSNPLIRVTRTDDPPPDGCLSGSDCSLREAVLAANAEPGMQTILIPEGRFRLSIPGNTEDQGATGDLDILDRLAIRGAGARETVLDAGGVDRLIQYPTSAIERVVDLSDLTITGGEAGVAGGSFAASGGGLLTCGWAQTSAQLTRMSGVVVRGNHAITSGGGIGLCGPGELRIYRSAVRDNEAGQSGGGLSTLGSSALFALVESTVAGNRAKWKAGIDANAGELIRIENSTIAENVSTSTVLEGGGMWISGGPVGIHEVEIVHSTIARNAAAVGDAVYFNSNGQLVVHVDNSIVQGHCAFRTSGGGTVTIESSGGNLESPADTCRLWDGDDLKNVSTEALALETLADRGGPAETIGLGDGSVAVAAALAATCLPIDERAALRDPSECDAGAFQTSLSFSPLLRDDFEGGSLRAWSSKAP